MTGYVSNYAVDYGIMPAADISDGVVVNNASGFVSDHKWHPMYYNNYYTWYNYNIHFQMNVQNIANMRGFLLEVPLKIMNYDDYLHVDFDFNMHVWLSGSTKYFGLTSASVNQSYALTSRHNIFDTNGANQTISKIGSEVIMTQKSSQDIYFTLTNYHPNSGSGCTQLAYAEWGDSYDDAVGGYFSIRQRGFLERRSSNECAAAFYTSIQKDDSSVVQNGLTKFIDDDVPINDVLAFSPYFIGDNCAIIVDTISMSSAYRVMA